MNLGYAMKLSELGNSFPVNKAGQGKKKDKDRLREVQRQKERERKELESRARNLLKKGGI